MGPTVVLVTRDLRAHDNPAPWRTGHTGLPIVEAGMRQPAAEGWLPNRASRITAGYPPPIERGEQRW